MPERHGRLNDVVQWGNISLSRPPVVTCPGLTNDPALRQVYSSSPTRHRQQSTGGDEFIVGATRGDICGD